MHSAVNTSLFLMGIAPMNDDVIVWRASGDENRVSVKIEINNETLGGKQGSTSFVGDDLKCKEVTADGGSRTANGSEVKKLINIPQQQPQGPHIHWERFLPLRSLKVLLVEDDDSTRHIVSALLRNCSYEVTDVSNGLQAWKYLEDPANHIDLILTEVAMPFLSGINLLSKIMNHKTLKNIPVIMTSSQDSMGIVFNCLSKGAVDFLVKPIRKNELKNLWQHVWRRCHSSSGSGSGCESGTQYRKFAKSRSNEASENNTSSSDGFDYGSDDISIRDGTDDGSGTQSSWTKLAAEVDSPHRISLADAPDSICAQVIYTKPEMVSNRLVHTTEEQEGEHGFKDLDLHLEHQSDKMPIHPLGDRIKKLPDADGELDNRHGNEGEKGKPGCEISGTYRNLVLDVSPAMHCGNQEPRQREVDASSGLGRMSQTKISLYSEEHPSLELSLKRMEGAADFQKVTSDDHKVLRHSNLSAFTKYNNASSPQQAQMGNVGSCSSSKETVRDFPSLSNGISPYKQSDGSEDNKDMVSTNRSNNSKLEAIDKNLESVTGIGSLYSSCSDPAKDGSSLTQQMIAVKSECTGLAKSQLRSLDFQIELHRQHHNCHLLFQRGTLDLQSDNDDLSLKTMARAAEQCVSSNVFGGTADSNTGNYSVNGSASGSDHGSNGQKGSCTWTTETANAERDNGAAVNDAISAANEGRVALREAALTKFRQKRKERCFEKKVRYHSRKKLAEQRPRIRGQFVRKIVSDDKEENSVSNGQMSTGNSQHDMR